MSLWEGVDRPVGPSGLTENVREDGSGVVVIFPTNPLRTDPGGTHRGAFSPGVYGSRSFTPSTRRQSGIV